jgi:hypothetical protein
MALLGLSPHGSYLPPMAACRIRFWRAPGVGEGTRALRACLGLTFGVRGGRWAAGDEDFIRHLGHLFRRSGPTRRELARGQTTGPRLGDRLAIRLDTSEIACRT